MCGSAEGRSRLTQQWNARPRHEPWPWRMDHPHTDCARGESASVKRKRCGNKRPCLPAFAPRAAVGADTTRRQGGPDLIFCLAYPPRPSSSDGRPVLLIVNRPFFVNPPPPRSPERIARHLITVNHPHSFHPTKWGWSARLPEILSSPEGVCVRNRSPRRAGRE